MPLSGGRSFQVEEGHSCAARRTERGDGQERGAVWTGFRAGLWGRRPGLAGAVLGAETGEARGG